jgi:hypothetical protein
MDSESLNKARAAVAAAQAAKAEAQRIEQRQQEAIAHEQAKFGELKQAHAALEDQIISAQAELAMAEEEALAQLNLEMAAEIVKRHAADPLSNSDWIIEQVTKLRDHVRSGFDTPLNQLSTVHPLITQALSLVPPRDSIDIPVYQLSGASAQTAWPARRRKILQAAFPDMEFPAMPEKIEVVVKPLEIKSPFERVDVNRPKRVFNPATQRMETTK